MGLVFKPFFFLFLPLFIDIRVKYKAYYGEKETPATGEYTYKQGGNIMMLLGAILVLAFVLVDKDVIKVERA